MREEDTPSFIEIPIFKTKKWKFAINIPYFGFGKITDKLVELYNGFVRNK